MPETGESDAGLFDLSFRAYSALLPEFARDNVAGAGTGERNFLPFVPWVAAREVVVTIPCTSAEETIGVNTREELAYVERYLMKRSSADA
jgi:bifunctional N-acetylglucosamine-1-phosphate-uridyltransferase/glucosamine-1-phosphate-acetyltransferase GlmU-like protein